MDGVVVVAISEVAIGILTEGNWLPMCVGESPLAVVLVVDDWWCRVSLSEVVETPESDIGLFLCSMTSFRLELLSKTVVVVVADMIICIVFKCCFLSM